MELKAIGSTIIDYNSCFTIVFILLLSRIRIMCENNVWAMCYHIYWTSQYCVRKNPVVSELGLGLPNKHKFQSSMSTFFQARDGPCCRCRAGAPREKGQMDAKKNWITATQWQVKPIGRHNNDERAWRRMSKKGRNINEWNPFLLHFHWIPKLLQKLDFKFLHTNTIIFQQLFWKKFEITTLTSFGLVTFDRENT